VKLNPRGALQIRWNRKKESDDMKLGIIITQTDPETVFNVLRLALYSLNEGDDVRIFLSGRGVEIDEIDDPDFDVQTQVQEVLETGGEFLACGTCLRLRESEGSEVCPLSTLKDHYEVVRDSDRLITI
jgi:uncharacterized protein involved in oxidation of intracellular sulfur